MTCSIDETDWDRSLLDYSSKCAEPLVWAYGLLRYRLVAPLDPAKFDNCQSKIAEIALRTFIVLAGAFSIATGILPAAAIILGIASKVLRAVGFALQKDNYTHVRGTGSEKVLLNHNAKVMTWNICGIGGGMNYDHGGVVDFRLRLNGIVDKIATEDPDVLVLEEVYDTALAEALIERLGSRYAHFFTHLGANTMGSVGGLMVLSKCAVHRFSNSSFTNNHWTLNRTFASLEIKASPEDNQPCARIIGTHFIHDNNDNRMAQLQQVVESLKKPSPLPTILMGDLNLERDLPEEGGVLAPYLEHGYLGEEPTATNQMLKQWDPSVDDSTQFIDYISLFKGHPPNVQLENVHLIKAYEADFNTRTALSDHNALAAVLSGI
jgi:endonuclease/exonuclease/phosphatase family metal-dependent hydrolase